jgi:uncharacterized membrane protein
LSFVQSNTQTASVQFWRFFAAIIILASSLYGFYLLLGCQYSPESYKAYPNVMETIALIWLGLALMVAIITLVWLLGRPEKRSVFIRSMIPLTVVSLMVFAKSLVRARLHCYDMILFCSALGWGIIRWTNGISSWLGGTRDDATKHDRIAAAAVWMCILLFGLYFVWQQTRCWNQLALGYADFGVEASRLYNTVSNPRELFLAVNPEEPMFWDHLAPGILAFVPLWLLWPDPRLLIVLQVLVVIGVAWPLYAIGKHLFQENVASLLLVLAWLAYPSTSQFIYNASYGFNWGNICLPLYFIALALWMKDRKGWALAAITGAFLMKEEAAIVVGMFGLYLAVFERRRWLGLVMTIAAFGYFILVTTMIVPAMKLGHYVQMNLFAALGANMGEILLSPFTKPRIFWGRLFELRSWYFAAVLLAPLLFFPLKKPSILFVGLLTFVFDCLHPMMKSISYHYQAALLPVIFWALAAALKDKEIPRRRSVLLGVVTSGVMLSLFLGNTFWSKETLAIPASPGRLELVQRMMKSVPPESALFATQRAAAHRIQQRYLYTNPPIPTNIDFVLLDLQDRWRALADLDWLGPLRDLQHQAQAIPALHLTAAEDGLLLYSRHGAELDARHLVEQDFLPQSVQRQIFDLSHGVRIEGFTTAALPFPGDSGLVRLRVTAFSTITTPTTVDLAARCILHFDETMADADAVASNFQPLGQGIWSIARWETNKFYADAFLVPLPRELSNKVSRISFEYAVITK